MNEKVRVLNPVACIRPRFSNLIESRRDPEIARINTLKIPCYFFLLEQFDQQLFKHAREIFMELWRLADDENCLRQQVFWHTWQGLLMQKQQSNNITLPEILEAVHRFFAENLDDFEIPEAFVTKELPLKVAQLRDRFNRYIELGIERPSQIRLA